MQREPILFEGFTADDILALPDKEISSLVFIDEPIVFKVGTAEILGSFKTKNETLTVELAHIDGGGEGILPLLFILVKKFARQHNLQAVEWIVHALNCAKPNPKLRPTMEKIGFAVKDIENVGKAYYLLEKM